MDVGWNKVEVKGPLALYVAANSHKLVPGTNKSGLMLTHLTSFRMAMYVAAFR